MRNINCISTDRNQDVWFENNCSPKKATKRHFWKILKKSLWTNLLLVLFHSFIFHSKGTLPQIALPNEQTTLNVNVIKIGTQLWRGFRKSKYE